MAHRFSGARQHAAEDAAACAGAELSRLRQEFVQLRGEFERLHGQGPYDGPAHQAFVQHTERFLAALAQWRQRARQRTRAPACGHQRPPATVSERSPSSDTKG